MSEVASETAEEKYSVSGNVVLVKSKETGAQPTLSDKELRHLLAEALVKNRVRAKVRRFKTGSTGFFLWGRMKVGTGGKDGKK